MQLMPRLTGGCRRPWVAPTRLSRTGTLTPQPTPQKRQGALDHFNWVCCASVTMFWLCATLDIPAAAVAVVSAELLMKSRRVSFMPRYLPLQLRDGFRMVIDHADRQHALAQLQPINKVDNVSPRECFEQYHDLACRIGSRNLNAGLATRILQTLHL